MDSTAMVHSSDRGYLLGEFRMFDKRLMYEPSIRVPMMIRYPRRVPGGVVRRQMVLDLDIAPTILELAGVTPRKEMQGESMLRLVDNENAPWRKEWLYDYYEYPGYEDVRQHRGVRTETHKLCTSTRSMSGRCTTSPTIRRRRTTSTTSQRMREHRRT